MKILNIFLLLVFTISVNAQDALFSNFGKNKSLDNPAFCSFNSSIRSSILYQNLYPSISEDFRNYSFYLDGFSQRYNMAAGLMVIRNDDGSNIMNTTRAGLQLAKRIIIEKNKLYFQIGFNTSYIARKFDYHQVVLSQQLDPVLGMTKTYNGYFPTLDEQGILDFSMGVAAFYKHKKYKHYIGIAANHFNRADFSVLENHSTYYTINLVFNYLTEIDVSLWEDEIYKFVPELKITYQNKASNLTLGTNVHIKKYIAGLWLKTRAFTPSLRETSIALALGFHFNDNIEALYSYDFPISNFITTGGVHEVCLLFDFE